MTDETVPEMLERYQRIKATRERLLHRLQKTKRGVARDRMARQAGSYEFALLMLGSELRDRGVTSCEM